LVVDSKETGLEVNADKSQSCLDIRIQDEVTARRMITVPSKGWKSSYIWEQF